MDPFALLSSGARFSKQNTGPNNKRPAAAASAANFSGVAQPLPALPSDPQQQQQSQQRPSKRQRRAQAAAAAAAQQQQADAAGDAAAAGGISLFGGSSASQQSQRQQKQDDAELLPVVNTKDPHEEANVIRKALKIKVKGSDIPPPLKYWSDLQKPTKQRHQHRQQQQHDSDNDNENNTDNQQQQHKSSSSSKKKSKQQAAAAEAEDTPPLISHKLMAHLSENGWHTPTPIQRQAVPALLAQRELLAVAPTGSGKTLAFLLPMMAHLSRLKEQGFPVWHSTAPKALLLSPTHELAAQTARVLKLLLPGSGIKCCLLSKKSAGATDLNAVDVLIANPLRLKCLEEEGKVDLSKVSYLVLDEADKLLAMGFAEQVDALLAAASNPTITRALFSATLREKVEALARSVLRDPLHITVGERNSAQSLVSQKLMFVGRTDSGKMMALRQLLSGGGGSLAADGSSIGGLLPPILVFVATKERAKALHKELMYQGIHVDSISGDQPNSARTAAVDNFRAGKTWVLIATDLIGRGMDFAGVNTVINYDFPTTTADYIHRVGRTGRAGNSGLAITFFTEHDAPRLRGVAHLVTQAGSKVPDWMLHMTKQRDRKREQMRKRIRDERQQHNNNKQQQDKAHALLEEPDSEDQEQQQHVRPAKRMKKVAAAAAGAAGAKGARGRPGKGRSSSSSLKERSRSGSDGKAAAKAGAAAAGKKAAKSRADKQRRTQ